MAIEVEDYVRVLKDIYVKICGAENLAKDGKTWYVVNKLSGLRQKIEKEVLALNVSLKDPNESNSDQ